MSKYINNTVFNSRKTLDTFKFVIGVIGTAFWGIFFMAGLVVAMEELSYLFFALLLLGLTISNSLLIYSSLMDKKLMSMVNLYARYFEGDLDGFIYVSDLINIAGKDEKKIYNELSQFLRKKVMTGYVLRDFNGKKQVVLESKTRKYKCKNCGAIFEKRIDFAGACPYCGGSDIFAELDENK